MDSTLKTILIIAVFAIITILLFKPFDDKCDSVNTNQSEHYTASFDPKFVDPLVHPYSKNIVYRPDSQIEYKSDMPNNRVYDHLDSLNNVEEPVKKYSEEDGEESSPIAEVEDDEETQQLVKKVRFSQSNQVINNMSATSSYNNTEMNAGYVNESNNIVNYCTPTIEEQLDSGDIFTDVVSYLQSSPSDSAIENTVQGNDNSDMDEKTYFDMVNSKPNIKTYIRVNDSFGTYTNEENQETNINSLEEITNYMDQQRNKTMDTINKSFVRLNPKSLYD